MISLDTEATGVDVHHDCKPFFVTICNERGEQLFWEWHVDPLTREPEVVVEDLCEIEETLNAEPGVIVLQNPKFDFAALDTLSGIGEWGWEQWPWEKIFDTLTAGHLLASNHPHDLTSMTLEFLGVDIEPFEKALEKAVKEARTIAEREFPEWKIAKKGLPQLPSIKEQVWRADYWLPRAVARQRWESSEAYAYIRQFINDWEQGQLDLILKIYSDLSVTQKRICRSKPGWNWHPPELGEKTAHHWWTVLRHYGNQDSGATIELFKAQKKELERRGLWDIYLFNLKLPAILYKMEGKGVTGSVKRHQHLYKEYKHDSAEARDKLMGIAKDLDYELELPKSGNNNSLSRFCFGIEQGVEKCKACKGTGKWKRGQPKTDELGLGGEKPFCFECKGTGTVQVEQQQWLNLNVIKTGKKSEKPALDKTCLDEYLATLNPRSPQYIFTKTLKKVRTRDTAITYLEGYQRFWRTLDSDDVWGDWFRLYPSLNPTGTDTLRFSSSNPNAQNISKAEEPCPICDGDPDLRKSCEACKGSGTHSLSLRFCFGPLEDEEWWALDYENIELRIPAYESGEPAMIELFERPDEGPYFGSYHLLNASIVYPDLFWPLAEQRGAFKKKYASTWYQWCKNGGFCKQYGGQKNKTDTTFHKTGAFALLDSSMPLMAKMNNYWISFANRYGYVETRPDKTVCPERGYPLLCGRSERGTITPTIPLNYRVQGSAMWCTRKAMVRCEEFLNKLSSNFMALKQWVHTATRGQLAKGYRMILQVHDEIVFVFPKGLFKDQNLPIVRELQRLMEQSGDDIGIPLRVAATYHPETWAEGVAT